MPSDPVWVMGRVPNGYWTVRHNRLRYLRWLGRRLEFRRPDDWYQLTRQHLLENAGGGVLAVAYGHSPLAALRDLAPHRDWKPWLMRKTPQGFWARRANRKAYFDWLGETLGFATAEDWYQLRKRHLIETGAAGLMSNYFNNSILQALADYRPDVRWLEWRFAEVPQRFWANRDNRRRYLRWLGRQLGYRRPEDWYRVTRRDFLNHHGGALLNLKSIGSPRGALADAMPEHDWLPWKFVRVPNGYWQSRSNRRAYARWLGQQLGVRSPQQWRQVTAGQIRAHGGSGLLTMVYHNALSRFLRDAAGVRPA